MKFAAALFAIVLVYGSLCQAQSSPEALSPKALEGAIAAKPQGAAAEQLAEQIRTMFGGRDALLAGAAPKTDELLVAWAIELPRAAAAAPPRVARDTGNMSYPMVQIGNSGVWALTRQLSHGTAFTWHYEADGRRFGGSQLEVWETHPDARSHAGVPKGAVKQMPPWTSTIFKDTKRDWWLYVPAQYRAENPAAVMVFQDGRGPVQWAPIVFDNLIAKGDMPVTVGIFIEPGGVKAPRDNRSFEYDTLSDQYVRFLLEEILPEVEKTVKLRHDGASRAIAGQSSGGICAFTVGVGTAPEFARVVSWTGSFTNIAAGDKPACRRPQLRGAGPQSAEETDSRISAGRVERSRQCQRQLVARQPDAGAITRVRRLRLPVRHGARGSTTICTAAPSFPTRSGGCSATGNP